MKIKKWISKWEQEIRMVSFFLGLLLFVFTLTENVKLLSNNFTLQIGFIGIFFMYISFMRKTCSIYGGDSP
ncbi:MAG TPA: hypothetical protein VJ438_05970 [Candidatus Nanoarchaeia archaeon]|nr:hypothetical protein [Candidatus Nanoarchaeia archaeon]